MISIPGTGAYINERITNNARLHIGSMNLMQMKEIIKQSFKILDIIESESLAKA